MKWFSQKRELDAKTVTKWIFSLKSSGDIARMREFRKQVQGGMFNEIVTHLVSVDSEEDGQIAYLLIHFFSGRVNLPIAQGLLDVNPAVSRRAREIFKRASAGALPTEQFELTAVYNCVIEVANETVERHYEEALTLADHGLDHWPAHAELWRQRGVLRLALGDNEGALQDLLHAKSLKADMYFLQEPIDYAESRLAKTGK